MRNKLLTLLIATVLTGSFLVGCGGSETGADVNNGGTNTEANINDGVAAKIDSGKYKEYEYYYGLLNEEDRDKTYVDGTSLTTSTWEQVNMTIKIKESVNLYNPNKELVGLSKPNIDCTYILTNEEWSFVAFGTNFESNDTYPNGAAYIRTDELMAVAEVTGGMNLVVEEESIETEKTDEDSYVAEDIAKIKEAIEAAGLIYDESAFEGEDLSTYEELSAYTDTCNRYGGEIDPDIHGYLLSNFPMGMDNDEERLLSFAEFIKIYEGKSFIIEVDSDHYRDYDVNIYIK